MISFESFCLRDGVPIYLQIIKHVKSGIVSGKIKNGEELPSRRVLSALLGLNPNTVQRAYRILEEEGLIESHSGAKSLVSFDPSELPRLREELLALEARGVIESLGAMGISREEAHALIDLYWGESNK